MMIWSDSAHGNVTVTVPDMFTLLAELGRHFEERQGFLVATINLDHVVKLARDPTFCDAYGAHSHVTADGNPIVWLSRLAGQKDVTLLPGSELIAPVCQIATEKAVPVGLFGTSEASLAHVKEKLKAQFPGIDIVLALAPDMDFDPLGSSADDMIDLIGKSGARLVFLALGAPKQEIFGARAAKKLPETGFLSIGAGLDFISGTQTRAPNWARAFAVEWLWRMASDPKRLGARYCACMFALPRLTLRAVGARLRRQA